MSIELLPDGARSLDGRGIILTGAASGIGRRTAIILAQHGARLFLADRAAEPLAEVESELRAADVTVSTLAADLAADGAGLELADAAESALGEIHGGVFAAGIVSMTPALEITPEEWANVLAVNLSATFFALQATARKVVSRSATGSLVVLSSGAGISGFPKMAAYAASKAGVAGMARCFALDLAPAIRVNAIAPGAINTPMMQSQMPPEAMQSFAEAAIPAGRTGTPEEIATVARFLLSDESSFITGQTIHPNGGMFLAS